MKSLSRKVDSFDGQTITVDGKPCYELGGFLGGGAAGVVYEGVDVSGHPHVKPVAIKILKPVGFRLAPEDTFRRCVVAKRGRIPGCSAEIGNAGTLRTAAGVMNATGMPLGMTHGVAGIPNSASGVAAKPHKLGPEHVWWLVSPNTKQVLAAYIDPRYGNLVELPLPKCIEIWGYNPRIDASSSSCGSPNSGRGGAGKAAEKNEQEGKTGGWFDREIEGGEVGHAGTGAIEVQVDGMGVSIPWVPPKFVQWLTQRRKVRREICNMSRVGSHRNVLKLLSVLEFLQDSKSTLFLILELVTGGELLDHIRPLSDYTGIGNSRESSALRAEGAAQRYFGQLLSGLAYCHRQGVCHRDLSPSNLLLAESPQGGEAPELKIADFGLSACCAVSSAGNKNNNAEEAVGSGRGSSQGLPHLVKSVVGSPHYIAPEVTSGSANGYDGFKADAWSCGIVLYTMLTASLPFGRELARCSRYKRFRRWAEKHKIGCRRTSSQLASFTAGSVLPQGQSISSATTNSAGTPADHTSAPGQQATIPPTPPQWLFPPIIPPFARSLLVALLTPDPTRRMSVEQALSHPWLMWTSTASDSTSISSCNSGNSNRAAAGAADGKLMDVMSVPSMACLPPGTRDRPSDVLPSANLISSTATVITPTATAVETLQAITNTASPNTISAHATAMETANGTQGSSAGEMAILREETRNFLLGQTAPWENRGAPSASNVHGAEAQHACQQDGVVRGNGRRRLPDGILDASDFAPFPSTMSFP